ncbi:unnamed protein product, partial [Oreochromis niloticus]
PFHNTNEQLLTEELQRNAVQHFWCVSATHCQSDERYTEFSRNHQCTCNALTFLAYLNEEHQFNTARLDKVLEQGDALYCWIKTNLQQERRYTQDHLTMEDLPKEVHADINVYSVKMDNIRYGYLKAEDKTYQRKGWWLPLASRLVCLSTDVNYALLMVSPQCIAVFRDKSGRPSNEAQLLQVQLKRHIRFKGYQHFYTVNMKNVLAGLSKLKEMHSEYKDVSIDDDTTFADPTNNQIIETQHDTADADIQDALPRNFDNQIVPERRTTEDTTAGILEPCHDVNELLEPEQSNGEPLQETEKEKEELRPGLVLDTCMQPPDIAQDILSYGEGIFSIAPAQGNRPVGFFSVPKLEAMAFPVQFPTGQNTLDEARQVKLSPSMYFNTRLFSADTRFATDQSYLFFAQFVTETHMATNSMSIQLRKGKAITKDGRRICNRMLQNRDEVERLINNKDATRFMKPLRGTPAYWEKALKDLHAMVRQLGKPTFFLTFSAAEMRWPEVVEVIKTQQ